MECAQTGCPRSAPRTFGPVEVPQEGGRLLLLPGRQREGQVAAQRVGGAVGHALQLLGCVCARVCIKRGVHKTIYVRRRSESAELLVTPSSSWRVVVVY